MEGKSRGGISRTVLEATTKGTDMDRLLGPLLMRVAELLDRSLLIVPEVDETPPPPPDPQAEWTRQIRRALLRAHETSTGAGTDGETGLVP